MTTSCFESERAASSSGRTARWEEDMQAISRVRAVARQSGRRRYLRHAERLPARESRGDEDDDHDDERLDGTNARNPVRGAECRGLIAAQGAAPADQRDHRPDLE